MLFNSTMVKFSFVCTATSLAVIKNSHSWFSGPEQPKHLTNQQNNKKMATVLFYSVKKNCSCKTLVLIISSEIVQTL